MLTLQSRGIKAPLVGPLLMGGGLISTSHATQPAAPSAAQPAFGQAPPLLPTAAAPAMIPVHFNELNSLQRNVLTSADGFALEPTEIVFSAKR